MLCDKNISIVTIYNWFNIYAHIFAKQLIIFLRHSFFMIQINIKALSIMLLNTDTSNGWIITLTVIISIVYFGIIIAVIFAPVKDLAPMDEFDLDFDEQKINANKSKQYFIELSIRNQSTTYQYSYFLIAYFSAFLMMIN